MTKKKAVDPSKSQCRTFCNSMVKVIQTKESVRSQHSQEGPQGEGLPALRPQNGILEQEMVDMKDSFWEQRLSSSW